jgi:hypothetical protein
MRINFLEDGIRIDEDQDVLAKIEGQDLSDIDVSDLRLDAHTLSLQYNIATSTPKTVIKDDEGKIIEVKNYHEAKRYAVLKQLFLQNAFGPKK